MGGNVMSSSSLLGFARRAAPAAALGLALGGCGYHSHDYFPPPVTIPVPNSVAIADVNGDGTPDLLVATTADQRFAENAGYANVILNSPTTPGSFSTGVQYPTTSSNPSSIAVADLTGSGSLDLAVANFSRGSLALFMHGATPGTFQSAVLVPTGGAPNQMVAADIDGDGKTDLVLADLSASGSVILLLQDAANPGKFLAPVTLPTGNATSSVAIGDLNGDGEPDIVAATYDGGGNNGTVYVFYQSAQRGRFAAAVKFPAGAQPQSVKIADVNADDLPDIVVANFGPGTDGTGSAGVSVLLQDPAHPGSFLAPVTYTTAGASIDVAVADLDGDGRPDLVVANLAPAPTGSISVLLQDPAHAGAYLAASDYAGFGQPLGVAVADLNGDGHPDIAAADGTSATVLLQIASTPGKFAPAVQVGQSNRP